jgi:hypothetical protein
METIMQHNITEQPMERGVQTRLRENTKYGNADNSIKTRRLKNSKYKRNNEVYDRTTHSRRQCPRRHRSSQERQRLKEQPIETTDDREFTQDEGRQIIEGFNPRKAPGLDGIASEILKLIFKSIPETVTSNCNECLKRGCFQKKLEDS